MLKIETKNSSRTSPIEPSAKAMATIAATMRMVRIEIETSTSRRACRVAPLTVIPPN